MAKLLDVVQSIFTKEPESQVEPLTVTAYLNPPPNTPLPQRLQHIKECKLLASSLKPLSRKERIKLGSIDSQKFFYDGQPAMTTTWIPAAYLTWARPSKKDLPKVVTDRFVTSLLSRGYRFGFQVEDDLYEE
ncbi:MAG: hypothetical protein KF892_23850 [Rhizobacter sp.]|nr:hypothetical protein [Rhizobacter sp.]